MTWTLYKIWISVFLNKVLLEGGHGHVFTSYLGLRPWPNGRAEQWRVCSSQMHKYLLCGPLQKAVNPLLRNFQKTLLNRDSPLLNKSYGPDIVTFIFPPFHFLSREVFAVPESNSCPPNSFSMCLTEYNIIWKMYFKHQVLSPGSLLRVVTLHAE